MSLTPRVRLAPAPTGSLHVGNVRAGLYNWLYARQQGGVFVLRLEDTDVERASEVSAASVLDILEWLGLDWDEGPRVGGPHGPYRQSQRAGLYTAVARRLEEAGHCYRDARTQDELAAWRRARQEAGEPPIVTADGVPPADPDAPASLRLRTPTEGSVEIEDVPRGAVTWEWATISDPVLVRSDGSATYPLANTVDDVAQGITLVCRGEDLLSVTPVQRHLYARLTAEGLIDEALEEVELPPRDPGWDAPRRFAHLPMIVGGDRRPLSKRHGSVAVQRLAAEGYLPEVLLNYLALLGWSPRDGRERMTLQEMVEAFSLEDVGTTAAAFDRDKLTAFNGERIRRLDHLELADRLRPYLDGTFGPDEDVEPLIDRPPSAAQLKILQGLVPLVAERMQTLAEIQDYAPPFFREDIELEEEAVAKVLAVPGAADVLKAAREVLGEVEPWEAEPIEAVLRPLADRLGTGFGKVAQPIRVATTGRRVAPPLFGSLAVMRRETVLERIEHAIGVAEQAET